jgi:hypothetical protein
MGILDDAIREHLDLKRKHGAGDDEVQILEDEAFGPPSRPGEPDFPERPPTGEEQLPDEVALAEDAATELEPVIAEPAPVPDPEATAVADAPPAETEPAPAGDASAGAAFFDQDDDAGPPTVEHPPPPPPEGEVEAVPAEEPLPEPEEPIAGEPEAAEEAYAEPAPPAAEPSSDSGEIEIGEIELELDEEFEEFRDTDDQPEEPTAAAPPPPPGEAPPPPPPAPAEPGTTDEGEAEGEDVLEETPEFLRDTPEDERLWFEQGEPKDFDFDEDEEDDEDRGR